MDILFESGLTKLGDEDAPDGIKRKFTDRLVHFNELLMRSHHAARSMESCNQLIEHALHQIASILRSQVVEYWSYDWNSKTAQPEIALSNGKRLDVGAHVAKNGIPLPQSLRDANSRPRRRLRTYVSCLDEQRDLSTSFVDYYRQSYSVETFVHFPVVENDHVIAGIIAVTDPSVKLDGATIEFAHALANQLMASVYWISKGPAHRAAIGNDRFGLVKEIFLGALDIENNKRIEFIADQCDTQEQYEEVTRLLNAHQSTENSILTQNFGDVLVQELSTFNLESREENDATCGRFQMKKEIGRGNCGVVYSGRQVAPVERDVAIKILKSSQGNGEHLARFRSECTSLAMMDHRNVVRILDAGVSPNGAHFFVMPFVDGSSLKDYCEKSHFRCGTGLICLSKFVGASDMHTNAELSIAI